MFHNQKYYKDHSLLRLILSQLFFNSNFKIEYIIVNIKFAKIRVMDITKLTDDIIHYVENNHAEDGDIEYTAYLEKNVYISYFEQHRYPTEYAVKQKIKRVFSDQALQLKLIRRPLFHIFMDRLFWNSFEWSHSLLDLVKSNKIPIYILKKLQKTKYRIMERRDSMCYNSIMTEIIKRTQYIYPRSYLLIHLSEILMSRDIYKYYVITKRDIKYILSNYDDLLVGEFPDKEKENTPNIRLLKYLLCHDSIKNDLQNIFFPYAKDRLYLFIFAKHMKYSYNINTIIDNSDCNEHEDIYCNRLIVSALSISIQLMVRRHNSKINVVYKDIVLKTIYSTLQTFTTRNITKSILYYV
jgi:hypothetical protein